jgi:DNA-binding transcriptional regulator YiaG
MTYEEFSQEVAKLGVSKSQYLRYLGMVPSTMAKWKELNQVPQLVAMHTQLLVAINTDLLTRVKGLMPAMPAKGTSE